MGPSWHSRGAIMPPSPFGCFHFLDVNSRTDRTGIGYIIIYSESFDGEPSYSCPLSVVYHRAIRGGILPGGGQCGEKQVRGRGRRRAGVQRRRRQRNEHAVEREARWTLGEKKKEQAGVGSEKTPWQIGKCRRECVGRGPIVATTWANVRARYTCRCAMLDVCGLAHVCAGRNRRHDQTQPPVARATRTHAHAAMCGYVASNSRPRVSVCDGVTRLCSQTRRYATAIKRQREIPQR